MKTLSTAVIVLCTHIAFGQWYVGGTASVTFSNYKTKTPWKEVSNSGFAFSATVYRQFNLHWGFNTSLEYIQKGYTHKICNTISDELNANYLEIPFTMDYTFLIPGIRNCKGHFNIGMYTSYWLSGKYRTEGFNASPEKFDFKKNHARRFDFGPSAGARLEYLLKNGSISLNMRYELGLADLENKVNDDTSNTNRCIVIGLSYLKMLGH
jgi:hypothetical protein